VIPTRDLLWLLLPALPLLLPSRAGAAIQETGFLDRAVTVGARTYRYQVYLPADFDRSRSWPVALFLHGSGERGDDGMRATQVGLAAGIRWDRARAPLVAVFPQCPADSTWLGEPGEAALAALDRTVEEFGGDPDRVYLTGLSMGGYGTWQLAFEHPGKFAALVPVCGGLLAHPSAATVRPMPAILDEADPFANVAARLRGLPVWVFHGAQDPVIPVEESRRMVAALRDAGADVRYTEYPEAGHACWDQAYGDPELWKWLLARKRHP
jgi:predicted peptidase